MTDLELFILEYENILQRRLDMSQRGIDEGWATKRTRQENNIYAHVIGEFRKLAKTYKQQSCATSERRERV